MASLVTYITYLYLQNPVVVSRLGGVMMGNSPGIPELVTAKNGYPLIQSTSKSISEESIESAIKFAEETNSHALPVSYTHLTLPTKCSV